MHTGVTSAEPLSHNHPPMGRKAAIIIGSLLVCAGVTVWLHVGQILPREQAVMCGIFLLAAALWVTVAMPLYATPILVVGLQVLLLDTFGYWPGLGVDAGDAPS